MYLIGNGVKAHEFAYSTYGELTEGSYGEVRFMYNGRLGVATDSSLIDEFNYNKMQSLAKQTSCKDIDSGAELDKIYLCLIQLLKVDHIQF